MAALAFSEFLQGHLSRLQQFNGHNNDLQRRQPLDEFIKERYW
jgi:hypothetical protein